MKKTVPTTAARPARRLYAVAALALLIILGQAREARAQWETSGGDIRSTNTGAVGIGVGSAESPSPYYKLDVRGLGIFGLTRKISLNADFGGNGEWPAGAAVTSLGDNSMFMAASPDLGSAGARAGMAYYNGWGWFSAAEVANVSGGGATRSNLLLMRGGGNVGVGTASPNHRLHVSGNNTAAGGYPVLKLENTQSGGHSYWLYAGAQGYAGAFGLYDQTAGAYRLFVDSDGNLGVGTTSPIGALHVPTGGVVIGQNYSAGATLRVGRSDANYPGIVAATNYNDGAKPIYRARSNNAAGLSGDGLYTFLAQNDATVRTFSADHHGNGYFAGSLTALGGLCIAGDCKTAWSQVGASQWANTASGINYASGKVGIGTSSPASIFSVNLNNTDYANAGGSGSHVLLTNPNAAGQNVVASVVNGATVGKWRSDYLGNAYWVSGGSGKHYFFTGGDYESGGSVRMTIQGNGNVGIGTSDPQKALDVVGDVNATGTITAGNVVARFQDVAEWVPTVQKLQPGTVVVLDPERSNHVLASATTYDTSVAGVVSAQPGLILGEGGEGRVMVATTGRVRVKVDATRGPIRIGDLLVTSDVEGVAMKSVPVSLGGASVHRPGTIIGKALEPLANGVGEILVLLSMQ